MLILVLFSTILVAKSSRRIDADEESAPLLGHGNAEPDVVQASGAKLGYGSITITPDGEGADLEWEAEQQKKDQENKARLEKRVQAEGNWFTYGTLLEFHSILCSIPKYVSLHQRAACK